MRLFASRLSPPAPPACLCALTILWRTWKRGVPVPIDFEPETTAQQRAPSSYASSSKASDCQAASLARSGGASIQHAGIVCRLVFFLLRGGHRGHRCWLGLWAHVSLPRALSLLTLSAPLFCLCLDRGRWNSAVLSRLLTRPAA